MSPFYETFKNFFMLKILIGKSNEWMKKERDKKANTLHNLKHGNKLLYFRSIRDPFNSQAKLLEKSHKILPCIREPPILSAKNW